MGRKPNGAEEQQLIWALWPEHAEHLNQEPGATMGVGEVDDELGIICNCGSVLGWPVVQDESEYVGGQEPPPEDHPPDDDQNDAEVHTHQRGLTDSGDYVYRQDDNYSPQDGGPDEPPPPDGAGQSTEVARRPEQPAGLPARAPSAVAAADPLAAAVPIIRPDQPYTPLDIERQLLDIDGRIERGMAFQAEWEDELYAASLAYDLAYARAINRSAATSADKRKAEALLACQDEYVRMRTAESMVRTVREVMHNLRTLQTGFQTVARSVAAALNAPNIRP